MRAGERGVVAGLARDLGERLVELAQALPVDPAHDAVDAGAGAAAAYSSGASRCSAAIAQKSPPSTPRRSSSAAAASRQATSSAPSQVRAPASGDQVCERVPDSPNGSNTNTSPSARRRSIVDLTRSVLIELATAGPFQSSSAGIAMPADLPDCGGPNATSA